MEDVLASVSTWRARPGQSAELEAIGEEATAKSAEVPGHLSGTVLHDEGSPEYHFVHRFSDRASLEAWLNSPARARLLDELEKVATRVGEPQRITGLETWFASQHREVETIKPPPRWKMWIASFIGAYPLVVVFQWQVAEHLGSLPLLVRGAILPLILLSLMTYLMMPLVTRVLGRWLYPPGSGGPSA